MRLDHPFIRLPLRFDAERLAHEIGAIEESTWRPHPQGFAGNSALPLIAAYGDPGNDATRGPMLPTPVLARLPYVRQVMESLGATIGRSRLMRLDGNAEATAHVDVNYYWMGRMRVHVPVVTQPEVEFLCGPARVHMRAGECWIFDTFSLHNVINPLPTRRIHLVMDTVGSDTIAELAARGYRPPFDQMHPPFDPDARLVAYDPARDAAPPTEHVNQPVVMSPFEISHWLAVLGKELDASQVDAAQRAALDTVCMRFQQRWASRWAHGGVAAQGYAELLARFDRELVGFERKLRLPNEVDVVDSLRHCIVRAALNPELAAAASAPALVTTPRARFERPVFIVSPPRSGSTLLFETLARAKGALTIGGESHAVIETIPALHPASHGFDSNRLVASDATPAIVDALHAGFRELLRDRDGKPPAADARALRMLEKTPKNSLRVPFLAAAFPDARFVLLERDPRAVLSSMLEAWRSQRFTTYAQLPGWRYPNVPGWSATLAWSLALAPGWRDWMNLPLGELVAKQWSSIVDVLLEDLGAIDPSRVIVSSYADLLADPQAEMRRLSDFAGFEWDLKLDGKLPVSKHTLTPPDPDKWKRNAVEVEQMLAASAETRVRLDAFVRARLAAAA